MTEIEKKTPRRPGQGRGAVVSGQGANLSVDFLSYLWYAFPACHGAYSHDNSSRSPSGSSRTHHAHAQRVPAHSICAETSPTSFNSRISANLIGWPPGCGTTTCGRGGSAPYHAVPRSLRPTSSATWRQVPCALCARAVLVSPSTPRGGSSSGPRSTPRARGG